MTEERAGLKTYYLVGITQGHLVVIRRVSNSMSSKAIIKDVQTLSCSNSWRNYYFVKITTEDGIVGWSEFDQNFGSPGVEAVIKRIGHRLVGQSAMNHEHIREDLRNVTRQIGRAHV